MCEWLIRKKFTEIVVAPVRHKEKVPPKKGKNRLCASIFVQRVPKFLGHPSPSPHFLGLPSHPPSQIFFKKIPPKNIYIFLESEVSPQKISHTPPLGVFLATSLSVQLKILHYLCYTGNFEILCKGVTYDFKLEIYTLSP